MTFSLDVNIYLFVEDKIFWIVMHISSTSPAEKDTEQALLLFARMLPGFSRITCHTPRPDTKKKKLAMVQRGPQLLIDKPPPLQEASCCVAGETFSKKVLSP